MIHGATQFCYSSHYQSRYCYLSIWILILLGIKMTFKMFNKVSFDSFVPSYVPIT